MQETLNSKKSDASGPMILAGNSRPAFAPMEKYFGKRSDDFSSFIIRPLNNYPTDSSGQEHSSILAKDEAECFQLPTEMDDDPIRYPSLHSGSEQCFDQLKKWYSICVENHERCIRERLLLPTRLLDIDTQGLASDSIALRDSKDLS